MCDEERYDGLTDQGLDPARYASTGGEVAEKQFFSFESQISDKERFKDAEPLSVRCMGCEGTFSFDGLLENSVSTVVKCVKYLERADMLNLSPFF